MTVTLGHGPDINSSGDQGGDRKMPQLVKMEAVAIAGRQFAAVRLLRRGLNDPAKPTEAVGQRVGTHRRPRVSLVAEDEGILDEGALRRDGPDQ